tara:strand:- start:7736 stop:9028 length:1293 start_codon:yes stop_codon:yes gene_type:complete
MDPKIIEISEATKAYERDLAIWEKNQVFDYGSSFDGLNDFTTLPSLLPSLISDIGNFSLCIFILLLTKIYKLINTKLFILSCLMMLSPFIFNTDSLISWQYFPDQSKYLVVAKFLRETADFNLIKTLVDNFEHQHAKVQLAAFFYAYTPLISIETFKSIGFLNRILFVGTFIFFIQKKYLPLYLKILIIFSPSLIIYTSISLRDGFILLLMIWSLYFFLKKSYISLIILSVFLYKLKAQNFLICMLAFYIIAMLDNHYPKLLLKSLKTLMIVGICAILFYAEQILKIADSARMGLYLEHNGYYRSKTAIISYENLVFDRNLIIIFLNSILRFISSPVQELKSMPFVIFFIETMILYIFMFKAFYEGLKIKEIKKITIIWISMFFISMSMYSLFIFNHGAITRYRIVLLFFILIGYEMHKYFHNNNLIKKV